MESVLMNEAVTREPSKLRATPERKAARGAAVFAAIWLALAVGSPLIVRYGPSPDDHSMAALATRLEKPRCATPAEIGYACASHTLAVRDAPKGGEPDL